MKTNTATKTQEVNIQPLYVPTYHANTDYHTALAYAQTLLEAWLADAGLHSSEAIVLILRGMPSWTACMMMAEMQRILIERRLYDDCIQMAVSLRHYLWLRLPPSR